MRQATIDEANKMLEFCKVMRMRREVAEYLGVVEPVVTNYLDRFPYAFKVNFKHKRCHTGNWMMSIVALVTEVTEVATPTKDKEIAMKNSIKVTKPADQHIAAMFGYIDHTPTIKPSVTFDADYEIAPAPRNNYHRRVFVSGNTLSMAN